MNQILSFGHIGKSDNYLKKVVKFFSFFIIIFGIILIVEGVLGYLKSKENKVYIEQPDINIVREGDITKLNISSKIGIEKVVYFWNDGRETTESINGKNNFELEIPTIIGTNDLNLEIVDLQGNIIKYRPIKIAYEEVEQEQNNDNWEEAVTKDKTEPVISLGATTGKVTINVTDDIKMSYITYSWNGGEEITITGLSDDEKALNAEIDALKGDNKLTIKAYDKAGNVATLEKDVHGTDGPKINVIKENNEIVVNVEDEFVITKIYYNFNGEEKTIDNINEKTYEFRLPLIDGENFVIVEAYENNVKSDYKGKTTKTN